MEGPGREGRMVCKADQQGYIHRALLAVKIRTRRFWTDANCTLSERCPPAAKRYRPGCPDPTPADPIERKVP